MVLPMQISRLILGVDPKRVAWPDLPVLTDPDKSLLHRDLFEERDEDRDHDGAAVERRVAVEKDIGLSY